MPARPGMSIGEKSSACIAALCLSDLCEVEGKKCVGVVLSYWTMIWAGGSTLV